jgi:hypothetical protein
MPIIHGNWHDFYTSLALNLNNGDPIFYMEILVSGFKSGLVTDLIQGLSYWF